jgi:hypothetical protein
MALADEQGLASARAGLLGAWWLVRWAIEFSDGRPPSLPFGDGAQGLLVYSADGWMNASIARAARAPLSAPSVRQAPPAEQCAAFESYFNYAGPFSLRSIDGAPHVVHAVRLSLNPNAVGSEQVRRIGFDADGGLTLSADERTGGVVRRHRLEWRRAAVM